MTEKFFARIPRRDFGDLLAPSSRLESHVRHLKYSQFASPDPQEIIAAWNSDPLVSNSLPELLICNDASVQDWTAWITTFAARLRPFSAFSRLVSWSDFESLTRDRVVTGLGPFSLPIVGLIIGEAILAAGGADDLDLIVGADLTSTMAFAVFRSFVAYGDFTRASDVTEKWVAARAVLAKQANVRRREFLGRSCEVVAAAIYETHTVPTHQGAAAVSAARSLVEFPDSAPRVFARYTPFEKADAQMSGTREMRVVAFMDFCERVSASPPAEREVVGLMIGYLADRIAPGSFQHVPLVSPATDMYPDALMWYGYCAGASATQRFPRAEDSSVFAQLPSVRRVLRAINSTLDLFIASAGDISYEELIALSRGSKITPLKIPRYSNSVLSIELLPLVWTTINLSGVNDSSGAPPKDDHKIRQVGSALSRLQRAYDDLVGNRDRGSRNLEMGSDLFEDPRHGSRR